jgi:hypothetical protein
MEAAKLRIFSAGDPFLPPFQGLFTILAVVIIVLGSALDLPLYEQWNVNLLTPFLIVSTLPLLFANCNNAVRVI